MLRITVNEHIKLKQVELSDAKAIFETINRDRIHLRIWLPFVELTQKLEDSTHFIHSIYADSEKQHELVFTILYDNVFVGMIGFKDTDYTNRKTEIGYWISESYQRKGIITESLKKLVSLAFDELNMNRIQIKCAVGNIRSKNIPIKLNFKFEGIERDGELLANNVFTDLEIFSLLKKDIL